MAELLGLNPRPDGTIDPSTLKMPNSQAMQAKLVKADYHGSIISSNFIIRISIRSSNTSVPVRKSKNPSLVGCCGIVILETENTFKVVTEENQLKSMILLLQFEY